MQRLYLIKLVSILLINIDPTCKLTSEMNDIYSVFIACYI